MPELRIGVVGATGAVGTVTLELLAERGFGDVRAFASSRSAGRASVRRRRAGRRGGDAGGAGGGRPRPRLLLGRDRGEPRARAPRRPRRGRGDRQVRRLPAAGRDPARRRRRQRPRPERRRDRRQPELLGHAAHVRARAVARARAASSACASRPISRRRGRRRRHPEAAGDRANRGRPLDGLGARRRGVQRRVEAPRGDEEDPRAARPALHATCVRVPILVGHSQAVWVETEGRSRRTRRGRRWRRSEQIELADLPTPGQAAGGDKVLVGRIRRGHRAATAWRSGSSTTTCAKARRSTPCRSPSCCWLGDYWPRRRCRSPTARGR